MIGREFVFKTGDEAYIGMRDALLGNGERVAPRGMPTRELRHVTIIIEEPQNAVPVSVGRKLNWKIGTVETLQLIGGFSCLEQLDAASNGRFSQFADDGILKGAYGPRVHKQVPNAIRLLCDDNDTRQAVIMIHQGLEQDLGAHDVPCTLSIELMIRDGKLEMKVHMRSNDFWLGSCYDWWMFSRLHMTIAWAMKIELGRYVHHVDSYHIYERDIENAKQLVLLDAMMQPPAPVPSRGSWRPDGNNQRSRYLIASRNARIACLPHLYLTWRKDILESASWSASYERILEYVPAVTSDIMLCELRCRYAMPSERFGAKRICFDCHDPGINYWTDNRRRRKLKAFGVELSYGELVARQGGLCAICQCEADLYMDHNHHTGQFRGLLCMQCNTALGLFEDSPEYLENAINYLKKELV